MVCLQSQRYECRYFFDIVVGPNSASFGQQGFIHRHNGFCLQLGLATGDFYERLCCMLRMKPIIWSHFCLYRERRRDHHLLPFSSSPSLSVTTSTPQVLGTSQQLSGQTGMNARSHSIKSSQSPCGGLISGSMFCNKAMSFTKSLIALSEPAIASCLWFSIFVVYRFWLATKLTKGMLVETLVPQSSDIVVASSKTVNFLVIKRLLMVYLSVRLDTRPLNVMIGPAICRIRPSARSMAKKVGGF